MESKQQNGANQRRSKPVRVNRETEQEAIIRRFHDAQRMARFRAKKKKALQAVQQLEVKKVVNNESESEQPTDSLARVAVEPSESKYAQLLVTLERIGKDVRLSYAGSRSSAERLKSGIAKARSLIRDCMVETRINLRQ